MRQYIIKDPFRLHYFVEHPLEKGLPGKRYSAKVKRFQNDAFENKRQGP